MKPYLQEYCCHKVDKVNMGIKTNSTIMVLTQVLQRISEIVKRKQKERLAQAARLARKEAAGDFSHLKNKKGEIVSLPQPTLPDIKLDDDEFDDGASTIRTRAPGTNDYYYNDYKNAYGDFPPPMPAYKQDAYGGGGYAQSIHSTDDGAAYYAEQYNSHTNLAAAAAPISRQANNSTPGPTTYSQTAAYDANYNQDSYSTYGYDQQQQQQHNGYGQDVPGAYAVSGDVNEYGQYSNYGYGQGQGQTQGAYAYEPQYDYSSSSNNNNVQPGLQTHIMNVPPRTASRAQNHQYDQSYQHQGYGGNGGAGGGYDAYGRGGNGGYAVGQQYQEMKPLTYLFIDIFIPFGPCVYSFAFFDS